jgi:NAD(P)-dependent dehydrogenase (short-subunit alcohol dehydrogenase family)
VTESPFPRLVDLTGRVALVTGAARGLGRAAVLRLHELGASVVIHTRDQARATTGGGGASSNVDP